MQFILNICKKEKLQWTKDILELKLDVRQDAAQTG